MKKSSKKPTPTLAPAKKSAPAARKATVTPTVKKTAAKAVVTTISARIDIGFGNTLYLRGEGSGLSWNKGLIMECTGDDSWTLVLGESARPVVFKFLVNDKVWSTGEDFSTKPGTTGVFAPVF